MDSQFLESSSLLGTRQTLSAYVEYADILDASGNIFMLAERQV